MRGETSSWQELLAKALPALDYVFGDSREDHQGRPLWTLGDGTAIALQIDHRISKDVALFVPTVPLKEFTPNQNPRAKEISLKYQWPGHYLKFELAEGEIDFLSPHLQTAPGFSWIDHNGRMIALETLEEVIIKKIRFRSHAFTPRDVYDLAAVALEVERLAEVMAEETPDALPRLRESLRIVEGKGLERLREQVILTQKGENILPDSFKIAREEVEKAIRLSHGWRPPAPR